MWIRKSPTEVSLEKRARLLRATCLDVLLGMGLWFILVQLSSVFGRPFQGPVSVYVGCAVIAILLPAAWFANWRSLRPSTGTMVCDRCNALKTADDQPSCNCGGKYLNLREMKWVNSTPTGTSFLGKTESHLLTRSIRFKLFRKLT